MIRLITSQYITTYYHLIQLISHTHTNHIIYPICGTRTLPWRPMVGHSLSPVITYNHVCFYATTAPENHIRFQPNYLSLHRIILAYVTSMQSNTIITSAPEWWILHQDWHEFQTFSLHRRHHISGNWWFPSQNINPTRFQTNSGYVDDFRISNRLHIIHCLFESSLGLITIKHQLAALLVFCEGNPPVNGGFPPQRASNAGSFSMASHHHVMRLWLEHCRYHVLGNTPVRHTTRIQIRIARQRLISAVTSGLSVIHSSMVSNPPGNQWWERTHWSASNCIYL